LMDAFDHDTRHLVKVHVVHGFWKQEDANRLALTVRLPFMAFHFVPKCRLHGDSNAIF
jgi:hypothetical protein